MFREEEAPGSLTKRHEIGKELLFPLLPRTFMPLIRRKRGGAGEGKRPKKLPGMEFTSQTKLSFETPTES